MHVVCTDRFTVIIVKHKLTWFFIYFYSTILLYNDIIKSSKHTLVVIVTNVPTSMNIT